MKSFLIGIMAFASIFAVVFTAEFVLLDLLSLTSETAGYVIMGLCLVAFAKPFGELTASVFNLNK
jgi:hypothetical protein|tara:strand:- start:262 stop:456 length:195 start_codon:yes stop_codon:yes gene_type:complete